MVQKIIEFSMTYPYLKDDNFCDVWPAVPDDQAGEKRRRYESYCCHVFNTLEHVWEHCQHDFGGAVWRRTFTQTKWSFDIVSGGNPTDTTKTTTALNFESTCQ